MNEFELIRQFFARQLKQRDDIAIGIGDDAAVVNVPVNQQLVVTTDTLVADIHFASKTPAYDIAYKALAVNLSDLAAMGAEPAWVTLALTLPDADEAWIQGFCEGFFTLASRFHVQLIGGDLTHGPLSITVQAMGLVPRGQAITRSGAKPGDAIYVTGTLGDAGLGLQVEQSHLHLPEAQQHAALDKLHHPEPRIQTGLHLRGLASAAIDISDGLVADLGHILEQSGVGATVHIEKLPISELVMQALAKDTAIMLGLSAGDDYELCFTVPAKHTHSVDQTLSQLPCRFTRIGTIDNDSQLKLLDDQGNIYDGTFPGYRHF